MKGGARACQPVGLWLGAEPVATVAERRVVRGWKGGGSGGAVSSTV